MSKGAYYQGLIEQRGIATTGPDFGEISDKFTNKILTAQANQATADKIAYQRLKDAADAKNAFLKEQREIGSNLFNRDKFDGTGIGDFDAMAEKAKASISAEFEGNNAMVDYIGQDAVRAKNNNIVKGYSDFLGVIEGAQKFMEKKSQLDKDGLSSYTDDLKINYLAELAKNAKFDIDANGTVYITTISEDGKTERSVPLSEVKAMLFNDIGADVDAITADILNKQEKGKKVFQVGTTEYTKYISGGQTELSKEATDLIRTSTKGLSYAQKIDALSELQKGGQPFIVSQEEYDEMSEEERKDKIVVGVEDVFKKDKEAEVDRLLEIGLSNKIFNGLKVMESQEQVDPKAGEAGDDKFVLAPTSVTKNPINPAENYDVTSIMQIMSNASGGSYSLDDQADMTAAAELNPDLYKKVILKDGKFRYELNRNAKVTSISVPLKLDNNTIRSTGISSSSQNPWASIDQILVVKAYDSNGAQMLDKNSKPIFSFRVAGTVSSKKTTIKSDPNDKNYSEQTQTEELNMDLSKALSQSQLLSALSLFTKNEDFKNAYEMVLKNKKQNDSRFSESDPSDFRNAVLETLEYFSKK